MPLAAGRRTAEDWLESRHGLRRAIVDTTPGETGMRIEDHWSKAGRLEGTRSGKLDTADDYELVIWGCIHGGAHLANVALHKLGVTEETFDLIHSDIPELNRVVPPDVADMLATLKSIEALGPRFVRGSEPFDPAAVKFCLTAYNSVKAFAERLINQQTGVDRENR
ncbi:MAG: hypothetical protein HYY78_10140 [Betaproteobacteria bacterium]|nr:hypothetical protein [Betaproteobacteria bacterium]